jgi:hypothetical protein
VDGVRLPEPQPGPYAAEPFQVHAEYDFLVLEI